jgi:ferredoxin
MSERQQDIEQARDLQARKAAQAAVEGMSVTPTGVVRYRSRGRVLVVGAEEAQWLAARLEAPLHAEVLLTAGDDDPGVPTTPLGGRRIEIDGHLGAFRVELGEAGRHNHQVLDVDLIVDLSPQPLIGRELPPPGYWHFGTEPQDLDAAALAVDGMVGTFEKPRYFAYDPDICAHSRAGQPGCRRCIEACPAEAIISIGERVEVNPNLCQGGGICASVCPSGAMQYAYPSPGDTGERLRVLLQTYVEAGGADPIIVFVAEADAPALAVLPPNRLLVVVEELASIGHELWLAALCWGAHRVLLADGGSMPVKARAALEQQLGYAHDLLRGMGHDAGAVQLVDGDASGATIAHSAPRGTGIPAATFAAMNDKRRLAAFAIDHLWTQAPQQVSTIALTDGAPYGEIRVDTEKCTLCMSCTSVCPARALNAGDETPRLVFHENNCVQCGICANSCPEDAITLAARYLADPEQRRQPVVLHEEPPFCCISCGKPFATRRVIDNILGRLQDHAMFQSERARRRLQMCEDCRVVDAVQDEEAMQAALNRDTRNESQRR